MGITPSALREKRGEIDSPASAAGQPERQIPRWHAAAASSLRVDRPLDRSPEQSLGRNGERRSERRSPGSLIGRGDGRRMGLTKRVVAAILLVVAFTAAAPLVAGTTKYPGPVSTSILSGATISEWSRPFDIFNPGTVYQTVQVDSPTVVPTRASVSASVAQARRTSVCRCWCLAAARRVRPSRRTGHTCPSASVSVPQPTAR
jgi:hypothetical protein